MQAGDAAHDESGQVTGHDPGGLGDRDRQDSDGRLLVDDQQGFLVPGPLVEFGLVLDGM
ncbi:hypothetical protein GCM10008096_29200 [Zhihengliuella salsuginis]|uniref:Uncharacterized protein n=1 Tax=Zhihengliuella salsuginis TaxID=578222 RepID=A0ABQ3GMC0_9MICC|nr:hypothetical protein GCM10008096_29200 [Zhihengliuella salsuginis]